MHRQLKILFVIRSAEEFHYHVSIFQALCQKGHRVELLFDKEWSKKANLKVLKSFQKKFPYFCYGFSLRRSDRWRKITFIKRELLNYHRFVTMKNQSTTYKNRYRRFLPWKTEAFLVRFPFLDNLFRPSIIFKIGQLIESSIPADKKIIDDIKNFQPDIVLASPTNKVYAEESEYVKAAKTLTLPTAIPTLSWDNLSTKGLIQVLPDKLFVWNKTQQQEAFTHHQILPQKTIIVGSSMFDRWFNKYKPTLSKTAFFKRYHLNPNYPLITYLGSTASIAPDESWLIKEVRAAFQNHSHPKIKNTQIIFRPHPKNSQIYHHLQLKGIAVYHYQQALPEDNKFFEDFFDTFYYSIAVLGVNTSAMIEAVIADKPLFSIITNQYSKTQNETQHFQQLIKNQVVTIINKPDELPKHLIDLLEGNDQKVTARRRFVKNFIRPKGLKIAAGEHVANCIENMVKQ